jgi:uncharacterized membrane protein HdeD (DUF308 family)
MHVVPPEPPRPVSSTRSAPYLFGLALALLGTFALVAAGTASLAAVPFVGVLLVAAGGLDAAGFRRARPTGSFAGDVLGGLLSVAAGLAVMATPAVGLSAAAVALGTYLVASALLRGTAALRSRHAVWGFPVVYSLVAGLLGLVILGSWDRTLPILLGAVSGMEIGARGVVLMAVSLELRRLDRTPAA